MKKVLVGCPTSDHKGYCLNEYIEGLKKLTYKSRDILIVDNSKDESYIKKIKGFGISCVKDKYRDIIKERIVHSRNIIRKKVLDENYDYFLSLEQDVIPPPDIIERLLKHKKKIISGIYFTAYKVWGEEIIRPLIWGEVPGKEDHMRFLTNEVEASQVIKIKACGLGCILIHKDVLKKVKFRYEEGREPFDDIYFCLDAAKKGFEIFADTSVKCKHLIRGMKWGQIEDEEKQARKNG